MTTARPTQTLRIERLFDCSLEQMWEAWTDPEQYGKWVSPYPGLDSEVHELDARVGGRIRFTMIAPNGSRQDEEGVFEVVEPLRELVQYQANDDRNDIFSGYPTRMSARFEDVGGRTRLLLEVSGLPPSIPLDAARQGFGGCLAKLESHLGARAMA